ncbi:MAG TPA: hypothetical protein VGD21_07495 [Lysobacter sp.]
MYASVTPGGGSRNGASVAMPIDGRLAGSMLHCSLGGLFAGRRRNERRRPSACREAILLVGLRLGERVFAFVLADATHCRDV